MSPMTIGLGLGLLALTTLLLSLGLTHAAARVATRVGFVDRPGGHKSHGTPTPYGGGAAIFLAGSGSLAVMMVAAALVPADWLVGRFGAAAGDLLGGVRDHAWRGAVILAGSVCIFAVGMVDDRRPLGAYPKLAAMLLIGLGVAWVGDIRLGSMLGTPASIALSVCWMVVIINAFNFLDNMDGLSAGVAAICGAFLGICGLMAGQLLVPAVAAALVGSVLGFLMLNFPPARIFMGDAGSLVIGYWLGVISIMTSYWESGKVAAPYALAVPICILAVPLYDFASVVLIRLAEGRSPLRGDQRHFSHRLVELGLSRRQAVLTIYLAAGTTGLCATLLPGASLRETLTVLTAVVLILLIIAILEMPRRRENE